VTIALLGAAFEFDSGDGTFHNFDDKVHNDIVKRKHIEDVVISDSAREATMRAIFGANKREALS
jgi:hypothetical protein